MRVEDLIEELETQYPDTVDGLLTKEDLIERQAQIKMIAHIKLIVTPPKKKKG